MPLPDDARFVLLAEQVLRQAGWQGEPFLGGEDARSDVDARALGAGAGGADAVAAAAGADALAGERAGAARERTVGGPRERTRTTDRLALPRSGPQGGLYG